MAGLTGFRPTPEYGGVPSSPVPIRFYLPVEANTSVHKGGLTVVNSAGNAQPAGNASGSYVSGCIVGRADDDGLNNPGAAGALFINVRQGAFGWDVSGSLTKANFGAKVYAVDDHTVILSNTSPNVTAAGYFIGLDPVTGMAWVWTMLGAFGAQT